MTIILTLPLSTTGTPGNDPPSAAAIRQIVVQILDDEFGARVQRHLFDHRERRTAGTVDDDDLVTWEDAAWQ